MANATHIFRVGDRLHCILYGGKIGIIYKIDGEQSPETVRDLGAVVMGGSAQFHIVFEDHVSVVPEAVVRGVQWRLLDHLLPASSDEIALALDRAAKVQAKKAREAEHASERKASERAALLVRYPYLKPVLGSGKTNHGIGAANIRSELKRVFPEVKFSVRSRSFAGGDSIDVTWVDGPTARQVAEITWKYQDGHFDGMTDTYEYDREHVWTAVFGGAKYVQQDRKISDELKQRAAAECGVPWPISNSYEEQTRVYQKTCEISLCEPKGEIAQERDHSTIPLADEFAAPVADEEKVFVESLKK